MKNVKGLFRIIFGRTAVITVLVLLQLIFLFVLFGRLSEYSAAVYAVLGIVSAIVVITIINGNQDASFKIAWIIPVMVAPIFGALFYLFMKLQLGTRLISKRMEILQKEIDPFICQDKGVLQALTSQCVREGHLALYMNERASFPTYENTYVKYFSLGEDKFEDMKIQLEQAQEFIFLEYFIIERGNMWSSILEILEKKVKEGVEVRVMYDGMCSLMLLPYHYPRELHQKGIQCKMFSPIKPALSTHQNNRDHRKILVIDGHTGFTGGVNLADEYINQKERFGHWKDTAVMLKGEAVKSLTMMFLQMWNINEKGTEDYNKYVKSQFPQLKNYNTEGFVRPYGDSPLDGESVGKMVYMDILYQAKQYVHIMTPYLILDQDMVTALTYAAKCDVETIIIMPHIPDKVYAYLLARTHYQELLEAGVRIFEYSPGFIHAKVFTSDNEKAVVGTINLDFRSLYLHFECAAYIYRNKVVADIEADFQQTLLKCQEITVEDCIKYSSIKKLTGSLLKFLAPLM